jgi:cytidine deaminase
MYIHALSGIRTHDPSVRVSEDIACLRPCGHCGGILYDYVSLNLSKDHIVTS